MNNLQPHPVLYFACAMGKQLDNNAYKGNWKGCPLDYLVKRAMMELVEVKQAIKHNEFPSAVINECADVANFMMMVADNYEQK